MKGRKLTSRSLRCSPNPGNGEKLSKSLEETVIDGHALLLNQDNLQLELRVDKVSVDDNLVINI